jgi:phosphatidate phosphatase APP1
MARESDLLRRLIGESEAMFDWAKYRLRRRRDPGQYHIQPYRGHGTPERLFVSGRVFEGSPVPPARHDDASFRNLWHTLRRLASDEVPAARVRATVDGTSVTVLTDDEGYFEAELPALTNPGIGEAWRMVELELLDPRPPPDGARATALAIVPPIEARFGIISDIDDTVVRTEVANLLRMLRLVLLTNAHTRLPFPGVAAFYRALHEGVAGPSTNPIFYVSSGPWNFYDLINEVFEVHEIPLGPLFLKDYGLARDLLLSRGHLEHKLAAIEHIFTTHPELPFVLIGDSGQQDPEVYRDAVLRYPSRVAVIYIRDVSPAARAAEVRAMAEEVAAHGVEMVLVRETVAAARHAIERDLIPPTALSEIRGEVG